MPLAVSKDAWIRKNGEKITAMREAGNFSAPGRVIPTKRKTSFALNFLRDLLLLPDCGFKPGELLRVETTGEMFFLEALYPKMQAGVVTSLYGEMLLVNDQTVRISRGVKQASKGTVTQGWQSIATVCANVEHVHGGTVYRDQLLLQTTEIRMTLQASVDVRLEDRIEIGGTAYKADDVNDLLLPGLRIVQLTKDTRR